MTQNNEAFEAKFPSVKKELAWTGKYYVPKTPDGDFKLADKVNGMFEAWQAANQASESEINSLKQRVEGLWAENTIMRETLNKIALGYVYDADIIESAGDCLQRLCTKKSLAEHDNNVIQSVINLIADDAMAISYQSMSGYRGAIIKQIGELKAEHD